jgi:ferric-dicitrate binding protein FerR (iron transport regulator)
MVVLSVQPPSSGDLIPFPARKTSPPTDGTHNPSSTGGNGRRSNSGDGIRRGFFGFGGSFIILMLILVLFVGDSSSLRIYATDIGEQLKVYLPDGTTAILNTDSELQSVCNGDHCDTNLIRGEALFDTQNTRSKHSRVSANGIEIGGQSQFNVRMAENGETRVTAVGGSVLVSSHFGYEGLLHEGQRAVFRYVGEPYRTQIDSLSQDDIRREISWQFRHLEFNNAPLGLAVNEINRYNRVSIELVGVFDEDRVSGLFSPSDPYSFARSISHIYPDIRLEIDDSVPDHRVLRLRRLATPGKLHRENHPPCERNREGTSRQDSCLIHRFSPAGRLGTA